MKQACGCWGGFRLEGMASAGIAGRRAAGAAAPRPDVDCEPAGVVENRLLVRELNAHGCRQIVALDLGLGILERPRNVVNVGPHRLSGPVVVNRL